MLILDIEDHTYRIKNSLDELTIKEFEDLTKFLLFDQDPIDLLTYFGVPYEICKKIPPEQLLTILQSFEFNTTSTKVKKDIYLNDVKYLAYRGLFLKVTVRDTLYIMDYVKDNPTKYLAELVAVIYKDPSSLPDDHYDSIEDRVELIRTTVTAEVALLLLNYLERQVFSKLLNTFTYED